MSEIPNKFLPIGTIINLKDSPVKIMITGFTAMKDDDSETVYDYIGCAYPIGFIGNDKMLVFDHEDIEKVYHLGYSDSEEKGFRELLIDIIDVANE